MRWTALSVQHIRNSTFRYWFVFINFENERQWICAFQQKLNIFRFISGTFDDNRALSTRLSEWILIKASINKIDFYCIILYFVVCRELNQKAQKNQFRIAFTNKSFDEYFVCLTNGFLYKMQTFMMKMHLHGIRHRTQYNANSFFFALRSLQTQRNQTKKMKQEL